MFSLRFFCVHLFNRFYQVIILDMRIPCHPVARLANHRAPVNGLSWAPHSSTHICTAGNVYCRALLCWVNLATSICCSGWCSSVNMGCARNSETNPRPNFGLPSRWRGTFIQLVIQCCGRFAYNTVPLPQTVRDFYDYKGLIQCWWSVAKPKL